jgi:SRSO17 transposase
LNFKTKTSNQLAKAEYYLCGLFQSEKRNIERMTEQVANSEYYSIQHFISESPWDARACFDSVAKDTDELFKNFDRVCMIFDESAITKKGEKSIGASRQYSGQLGKVDNCQNAVFAALSTADYYSLIDTRLYLPKEWTDDQVRCKVAGVPAKEIKLRTKPELALEILKHQKEIGTRFHWSVADGLYGHDSKFRKETDALGVLYMYDVHCDETVYLEHPEIKVPERTSKKGQAPVLPKPDKQSYKALELAKMQACEQWKKYNIRNTTKGVLSAEIWVKKVYTWDGISTDCREELLVVRKTKTESGLYEYKCSLSNAREEKYSWLELAQVQAQRYFVERSFQEAKQQAGMSEYQVRGWLAWHHHMAMVMMAMYFVLSEKILYSDQFPMLSTYDARQIIIHSYATKINSIEDVIAQMKYRHKQRKKAINQRYKT